MNDVNNRIYQLARTQVDMVKSALGKRFTFEDNNTNEPQGGYTTYGTLKTPTAIVVVRISNHMCSMNNWTERYKPKLMANNKLLRRMGRNLQDPYKDRCFFSVVFKAFDYQPNDNGKWKAVCSEYVFNPLDVEENRTIGIITQDCAKLNVNQPISINGVNPTTRTAIVPKKSNNQELNTEQYMNKKLIRLTEQDLHRIVKESVNKILNEIGDTPRGNFALNAVRGRRAAKHYRTNMGANAEAENNKVMGMAADTAWRNYRENPKLGYNNEAGYRYGFDKGVEKYGKV